MVYFVMDLSRNEYNQMTQKIIGVAIEAHKLLGPGFLESVYHSAMKKLLDHYQIPFDTEKEIKIYLLDEVISTHRLDLVVYNSIVVELKAVEEISKVHIAQVISYLKASGLKVGLILNFSKTKVQIRRINIYDILSNSYSR